MYHFGQRERFLGYKHILQGRDSIQHRAYSAEGSLELIEKIGFQGYIRGSVSHPIHCGRIPDNAKGEGRDKQLAFHADEGCGSEVNHYFYN